jgi:hypothetical protein
MLIVYLYTHQYLEPILSLLREVPLRVTTMCIRLNGNQLGVILSDLYRRYWMLRMKHKRSVEIQTKLANADMEVNAFRAFVQKHSLVIHSTQKISLVVRFLSVGSAQKTLV